MVVFKVLSVSIRERNQPVLLATGAGPWSRRGRERMWLPVCVVCRGGRQEVLQGPLGSASAPTPQPRGAILPSLGSCSPDLLCEEQVPLVGPPDQGWFVLCPHLWLS